MKKLIRICITLLLLFLILLVTVACGKKEATTTETKAPENELTDSNSSMKESIVLENFDNDNILGDLTKYGIEVHVPKDAFVNGTKLTISNPSEELDYNKAAMEPQGSTYEFKIEGDEHRSNLPILIKIGVDKAKLTTLKEFEGFKGVHYSKETGWTYTNPVEVNIQDGYVAFNIYNNPLWGTAELTEEERKEEFIKGKALQSWGESQLEGEVQDLTREMIENILVDQFNATNKSEIALIANEVLKELKYGTLEYGKLANDLVNNDFKSYTANVATMIGTTLANSMEEDNISTVFGQTGTVIAAAGHIWEGDYSGAGMKIAEAIAESSPVYKVAKVAVAVVDMKIGNWKNNGIEEAFKAFKEGSNDYILYGYDVNPGDFEDLWGQMRGVARQIEMDAIKRYANSIGVEESKLTPEQIAKEKAKAKEMLKEQFEKRIVQEDEIAKQEENQRELIKQFEEWNLLKKGSTWYPEDSSIEQMLERLYNQIKRIQKETGRFDLVYKDGDLHDQSRGLDNIGVVKKSEMLASDLAKLINTRYVYGEEKYQELLKEMGYAPEIKLELGTYTGSITITDAPIMVYAEKALANPEIVPAEIEGPDGETCEELDFTPEVQEGLREALDNAKNVIGKEVPLTIVITQGASENEFNATAKADFASAFPDYGCEDMSQTQEFKVIYENEKLILTRFVEDQMSLETYEGKASLAGSFEGTFKMTTSQKQYPELATTDVIVSGSWSVKK